MEFNSGLNGVNIIIIIEQVGAERAGKRVASYPGLCIKHVQTRPDHMYRPRRSSAFGPRVGCAADARGIKHRPDQTIHDPGRRPCNREAQGTDEALQR